MVIVSHRSSLIVTTLGIVEGWGAKPTQPIVRAEVLVVPRLNGQSTAVAKDGTADSAAEAEDSAADGLHSEDKDGAAGGAADAEGSAADGLHSEDKDGAADGAAAGAADTEDSAADGLHS